MEGLGGPARSPRRAGPIASAWGANACTSRQAGSRPGPSDAPNGNVTPILIAPEPSAQTAAPRSRREAALLVTNNATEPTPAT
jgi:hypothetical protein